MAMKFYSDIELEQHFNINDKSVLSRVALSKMSPLAGGINLRDIFDQNATINLNILTITGRYYSHAFDNNFTIQIKNNNGTTTHTINPFAGVIIVEDEIGPIGEDQNNRHKKQRIQVCSDELQITNSHSVDGCRVEFIRHFEMNSDGTADWGEWQVTVLPHVWDGVIGLPSLHLSTLDNGNTEIGEALTKLGFKQGNITTTSGQHCGDIAKLGKIVYGTIYNPNVSVPIRLSLNTTTIYNINLQIPNDFHSSKISTIYTSKIPLIQYTGANTAGDSYIFGDCTISNNTIIIQNFGQLFAPALANNIKHYFWYVLDDDFEPIPTV